MASNSNLPRPIIKQTLPILSHSLLLLYMVWFGFFAELPLEVGLFYAKTQKLLTIKVLSPGSGFYEKILL